ncbi:MAG: hypothetical protein ACRDZU_07055, partial [Acidimicrobiales bacterium]
MLLVLSLLAAIVGTVMVPSVATADSSVGSFEIDGNTPDSSTTPPVEPVDWDNAAAGTPPVVVTSFVGEASGNGKEDGFGGNSHNNQPATWACGNVSTPAKDDIVNGKIGFRTIGDDQFVYVNFTRVGTTGSVDIDWEFSKGTALHPSPSCQNILPARTDGDLVIAFDQSGNATPILSLLEWDGNATSGSLIPVTNAPLVFQGAVNGTRNFGEAALNISDALGHAISCGEFSTVYMKSRASDQINSDLKDRTSKQPAVTGLCPSSALAKAVRNITTDANAAFTTETTAKPGDTIEYRLTYTNSGPAAATTVEITDSIQAGQTYVTNSCSNSCVPSGNPVSSLKWTFPSIAGNGGSQVVTFQVTVDAGFGPGSTPIKNVGFVDTAQEPPKPSNETTIFVQVPSPLTTDKSVVPTSAKVGDTVAYSIKITNPGIIATTTTVTDNYDEDVLQISNISTSGASSVVDNGDTIVWTNVPVPANTTVTLTYSAKILAAPDSDLGSDGCGPTQLPVVNLVTITGGTGDRNVLCVEAPVSLSVSKTACPATSAVPGGQLTYTINYSNAGPGTATNAVLTDTVTSGGLILDGGGGVVSADRTTVTWNLGTIAPNTGGTKTITVDVTASNGGSVNDTATLTSNGGTASATPAIVSTPVSNAGASTHGSAFGLDARLFGVPLLAGVLPIDLLGNVSSVQPGTPADAAKTALPVNVPGVLSAGIITTSSKSDLTDQA